MLLETILETSAGLETILETNNSGKEIRSGKKAQRVWPNSLGRRQRAQLTRRAARAAARSGSHACGRGGKSAGLSGSGPGARSFGPASGTDRVAERQEERRRAGVE
jgi:hypothetical protein